MVRALAVLCLALFGCVATDFGTPGAVPDAALYDRLYPTYAELCAVSGIDKRPGFGAEIAGGPGGHSVLFLHGACRDRDAGYPTLRRCGPGDPPGAGVSANAHFANANWVATDGPDFLWHGDLRSGEALTRDSYRRTQRAAQAAGILDGVRFHPAVFAGKPAATSRRDWMYEMSVSTDYATEFGRGRLCGRLPLTASRMDRVIASLNARNAAYRDGAAAYVWNVLQNNCAHLTHNALAAALVWHERPVDQPVLDAAFTFPVPKNEVVNLLGRANNGDGDTLRAVYDDPLAREALLRDGVLPAQPGALLSSAPVRTPNDVYDPRRTLIFYQPPFHGWYQTQLNTMEADPRFTDPVANLRWFAALYAKLRAERRPLAWWQAQDGMRGADFPAFYARYNQALDRAAAAVAAAMVALT